MTQSWTMTSWTFVSQAPPVAGEPAPQQAIPSEGAADPNGGGAPPPAPFGGGFLFLLLGLMVFMLLLSSMGQRKEKKRRAQLLNSLAKHDRVQTMGGVIGTITEIRGDEVVVKVDESTNTKIRFAKSAVQTVLKKSGGAGEGDAAIEPEMAKAS
jgi:preprotein translocase subunit YajC